MLSKIEDSEYLPIKKSLFILILLIATLGQITADIYLPSLPNITQSLMSSKSLIQLTISFYMIGYSLSQLFYGPWSDRIGRRKPLLIGISISIFGTLICFASWNALILISGRLLQGLGLGVCNSVGRSITRDLYSGERLAKIGSLMSMASALMIAAAPTLGGYIQAFGHWRLTFLFLLIDAIIIWLMIWFLLDETNSHMNPQATQFKHIARNYWSILTHKAFISYTICAGIAYGGLLGYITVAPFLLQTQVGLTPVEFGWLSFLVAAAIFASAFFNSQIVLKMGIFRMVQIGIGFMLLAGISMLVMALLGWFNAYVIVTPVLIFSFGAGLTFSNAFAGAFTPFPKMAGSAAALYGCLQIFFAALVSATMAFFHVTDQLLLAGLFIVLALLGFFFLQLAKGEVVEVNPNLTPML